MQEPRRPALHNHQVSLAKGPIVGNGINGNWATATNFNVLTVDTETRSLLSGTRWAPLNGGRTLYYSFPTVASSRFDSRYSTLNEYGSMLALTDAQRAVVRDALQAWSNVANITFQEVSDNQTQAGDLRFAFTDRLNGTEAAHAYYPDDDASGGDTWFSVRDMYNASWAKGSFSFEAVVHEIGHALGLKHPFESSSGNYALMSSTWNNTHYTVMSYTRTQNGGTYAATPMYFDITAIQALYGANTSYNTGDDTYIAGNYDMTIWDAGGADTLSFQGFGTGATINLTENSASSCGSTFIQLAPNVRIENAVGGWGGDRITGNGANNTLTGGIGNDVIVGGGGIDTAVYSGGRSQYSVTQAGGTVTVRHLTGSDGTDTLQEIEYLRFSDGTYASTGTAVASDGLIYRFYNQQNGCHFYTASASERDWVTNTLGNFTYEGPVFGAVTGAGAAPVYRFYNRSTGSHFYTISASERDFVQRSLSATYTYEGAVYNAQTSAAVGTTALYRFYNRNSDSHFYTASESEMNWVRATLRHLTYEGVAYYVQSGSSRGGGVGGGSDAAGSATGALALTAALDRKASDGALGVGPGSA